MRDASAVRCAGIRSAENWLTGAFQQARKGFEDVRAMLNGMLDAADIALVIGQETPQFGRLQAERCQTD